MAKSKLIQANEKISNGVKAGYKKIEDTVVGSYKNIEKTVVSKYEKMEDAFVDRYLTRDGETVEDAKKRIKSQAK